jgi:hypothetical protein
MYLPGINHGEPAGRKLLQLWQTRECLLQHALRLRNSPLTKGLGCIYLVSIMVSRLAVSHSSCSRPGNVSCNKPSVSTTLS